MPKTPQEIAAKVHEIYALANASITPMSVLSLQCTILLGKEDWQPMDVERVSGEVIMLLIKDGWQKAGA